MATGLASTYQRFELRNATRQRSGITPDVCTIGVCAIPNARRSQNRISLLGTNLGVDSVYRHWTIQDLEMEEIGALRIINGDEPGKGGHATCCATAYTTS